MKKRDMKKRREMKKTIADLSPTSGTRRRVTSALLAAALAATGVLATAAPATAADPTWVTDPASRVNTLDGTGNGGQFVGSINNFPGATVPFGMVQFSPDTTSTYAGYQYHNDTMTGFSMNHASAGCNVFGDIPVLPATGAIGSNPKNATQRYTHDGEIGEPGYYSVRFPDSNIVNELTASDRVGLARITYPAGTPAQFMVRPGGSLAGNSAADLTVVDSRTVQGSATTGNFCGKGNSYKVYFQLSFDQDFTAHGTWDGNSVTAGSNTVSSSSAGAYFTFAAGSTLQAKIAVSYVSTAGAAANMAAEAPGFDFDGTRAAAHDRWNDALARVKVAGGTEGDQRAFYGALYRSLLHPNTFNDVDGRYIGFDGAVHQVEQGRTQYANFSDWDTYRTLIPLQTMLFPDVASDMAQSLLVDADQSGSLPRWPVANSATGQMTGDNVTALIGQIHAFGGTDFDARKALGYMVAAADGGGAGLRGYVQRPGAKVYDDRRYAPQVEAFRGDHQIVGGSITLEWSVDDFTVGRLARALGDDATASRFQARSNYWQNLFDPAQNAIAPRNADGSFVDVSATGQGFGQVGFDEGNAEQYLWMVPQNIPGLVSAIGGREAAAARLDTFTQTLNSGPNTPRLWVGNEPNFLVPWLYNYLGQPDKTQALLDRIRHELFSPGPDGAPGNDDLGAMSSLYVWATLGLAPATPGTSVLTVNTPTFDHTEIALGNGKTLRLDAPGASTGARYISALSVDGTPSQSTALPERLAMSGGTVAFTLAASPGSGWATGTDSAPPGFGEGGTGFAFAAQPGIVRIAKGETGTASVVVRTFSADPAPISVAATTSQPGLTAQASALSTGTSGALTGTVTVTVDNTVPDGFYTATVTAVSGATTRTQTIPVQVVSAGSFAAALSLIGTATADTRGGASFDASGNSYSREQLAKAGLTPGAGFAVGSLRATWPNSPAGQPDTVAVAGQTITVPNSPTTISFVGAARNGGGQTQATVTFDDGTTATTPLAFGDWVLPSAGGAPVYGNTVVAHQDQRYSGPTGVYGSYVFATAPYTAPAGRTIVSVTLPAGGDADKLRLFAIAGNGSVVTDFAGSLSLIGTSTEQTRGGADFDTAGNSYAREELAKSGLTPGADFTVGDLHAMWPASPAGTADTVVFTGQTITVPNNPTIISFVGSGRDGGGQSQVTVTFDDGSTATTPLSLGDWVLPSPTKQPVYGNTIVAQQELRHCDPNGVQGSFVYATAPYTAPAGRTIVSVRLASGGDADRLRLFAIASNGMPPQPVSTSLAAILSSDSVVEGGSVTATVTVSPTVAGSVSIAEQVAGVQARAFARAAAAGTPLVDGTAQLTVTPTGVGAHTYTVTFAPDDPATVAASTATFTVTVTAPPTDGGNTGGGNTGGGSAGGGSTGGGTGSPAGSAGTAGGGTGGRLSVTGGSADVVTGIALGALLLLGAGIPLANRARRRRAGQARG